MRILLATAVIALGIAGIGAARAADLAVEPAGRYAAGGFEGGERAGMLVVYDNQPGVYVRPYWRTPWHDHHYFPFTGKRPRIGRVENLNAPVAHLRPAQTFRRQWSNAAALHSAMEREQPVYLLPPDPQASPRAEFAPQNQKP